MDNNLGWALPTQLKGRLETATTQGFTHLRELSRSQSPTGNA
ncbi:hypothetical protein [Nostoc sp.]